METKSFKLEEIAQSFYYGSMPQEKLICESGYPVFTGYRYTGFYSEYNIPHRSIVVVARGVGGTGDVRIAEEKTFLTNLSIAVDIDTSIADLDYLKYYLNIQGLRYLDSGAAQSQITINSLKRHRVFLPGLKEQKTIVEVLSVYDNLIEINNKRIKLLEQMAENLYREWFVRFRFPGHETTEFVDSKIGKIPSSFTTLKMQDVLEFYIGGGWGNDDEDNEYPISAYVIRGTDFPRVAKGNLSSCPLRYHKKSNYSTRQLEPDDIILEVSGGTAEQPVGRTLLVTADTIERLGGKVICASFCKQVRVKNELISPIFFYYWMQFLYNTRIIDRFQLQSTGIINFQFEYFLRKGDILLPNKETMDEFDGKIRTIYSVISTIARQTENLVKQRDLLLPRLMSGKLEV